MGQIRLVGKSELEVAVEGAADAAAIAAAFRATPGSEPLPLEPGQNLYRVSLENLSNVCALWACGFAWDGRAMEAIINKLMPSVQRRTLMRATMDEIRSQQPPDRTRLPVE